MTNISTKGSDLTLNPKKSYFVMDALYLNDIRLGRSRLSQNTLEREIREKIFPFPYTDFPFAKVLIANNFFNVQDIKKVNYDDIKESEKSICFSCDTGLIIFVEENLLIEFAGDFSYDELVESDIESINYNYWDTITKKYNHNEIGLILAPGVSSGYEFEGSGTYKIDNQLTV